MKNRISGKIKNLIPYALLVLIIVLPWFLKRGYLFFTDMVWGPNMVMPDFVATGSFYLFALLKLLNSVLSFDILQKLFIAAVFGIVLFGGYKIAQNFTQNKIVLFLGSAFALFNPFVYDRAMYGQFGIILSLGFFLAMFGYLIGFYFEPSSKKKLFLGSVFAGLSILFAPHFIFFIALTYFVFGVLIFWSGRKGLLRIAGYFLLSLLIILAVNANWLYGVFFDHSNARQFVEAAITEQDLKAFKTGGDTPFEAVKNVFLMSGFWGTEQFRYEPLQNIRENWGRSFYFLLPIILWGLLAEIRNKEKRKLKIGLIILYIMAFILALGIALPITSKITLWLFNDLPFYQGLRETQKWAAVLVAVYQVLLVCGLVQLFKKRIMLKHKELAAVLLAFVIILQAPLLVWGAAGQVRPVDYPRDWYEVNELIVKETDCQSKILFLPWHLYMSFEWVGNIIANPSSRVFQCPVIHGENMEFGGIYSQTLKEEQKKVEAWLFSSGRTDLLEKNELNIGYIVLAKEIDWRNYLWIGTYPNIELAKETESLIVYRVHPVKYEKD